MNHSGKTTAITRTALCAALICILAPVSVPLPGGVPVSLATFAVIFAGGLLGAKRGTLAVLIYLLLGAFGLPVFAGYSGGLGSFVTPSAGYLIGYLFLAGLTGFVSGKYRGGNKKTGLIIGMLLGELVMYVFGTSWFIVYMNAKGTAMGLAAALGMCIVPFIPGDLIKMFAAYLLIPQVGRALKAAGAAPVQA